MTVLCKHAKKNLDTVASHLCHGQSHGGTAPRVSVSVEYVDFDVNRLSIQGAHEAVLVS